MLGLALCQSRAVDVTTMVLELLWSPNPQELQSSGLPLGVRASQQLCATCTYPATTW